MLSCMLMPPLHANAFLQSQALQFACPFIHVSLWPRKPFAYACLACGMYDDAHMICNLVCIKCARSCALVSILKRMSSLHAWHTLRYTSARAYTYAYSNTGVHIRHKWYSKNILVRGSALHTCVHLSRQAFVTRWPRIDTQNAKVCLPHTSNTPKPTHRMHQHTNTSPKKKHYMHTGTTKSTSPACSKLRKHDSRNTAFRASHFAVTTVTQNHSTNS